MRVCVSLYQSEREKVCVSVVLRRELKGHL